MDQENRNYLENFRREIILRLGTLERETTQLRHMFEDDSPTRASIKFARDQAGTAFIGVMELRQLWQKDGQKRSNITRLIVACIAAISLITVGVTQFIGNLNAAESELRARDVVRRENTACETRISEHEEHLARRVAEETIKARDIQIDKIASKKN